MAAAAIAVLIGGVVIANDRLATSGAEPCFEQQRGDIRAGQDPKLAVKPTADDRLKLVLDHQIEDARRDDVSVAVVTFDNAASVTELPVEPNVGARIDETPRAAEPLAFRVVAKGEPTDDGRGIVVSACTVRPNRDTKPGRYAGLVRVGGTGIVPADVPVEVTIRAGVQSTMLIAIVAAILGIALTHYGTPVQTTLTGRARTTVQVLSVVTGMIGGLAAAALAYYGDPVWGAERAEDTVELLIATAAAASATMSAAGAGAKAFNAIRGK